MEEQKQLLANPGSPQDRIKKWQVEVIKTDIDQNKSEAAQLSTVSSLAARMAQVFLALSTAVKAEQLWMPFESRVRPCDQVDLGDTCQD